MALRSGKKSAIEIAINGTTKGLEATLKTIPGKVRTVQAEINKGGEGLNIFGAALAGGVLSRGLTEAIQLGGQLARTVTDLSVQSVKLAGNFEASTNAMTVFAGSTRLAKAELTAIDRAAADTPGLRLEAAEKGYEQLRALGFQADLTKKLVVGLGKEKLLSPLADDGAIQRVIVNLTQLSTGSTRVAADIKEIIRALPSMRDAFQDAFGTIDPTKLKKLFESDPEKAIKKLANAMANAQSPVGGLNDALDKLEDQFTQAGRAFGEPFLQPVTRDVKDLTDLLEKNRETIKSWGNDVSITYRSLSKISGGLLGGLFGKDVVGSGALSGKGFLSGILSGGLGVLGVQDVIDEQQGQLNSFLESNKNFNPLSLLTNRKTPAEIAAAQKAQQVLQQTKEETARKQQLDNLKLSGDQANTILKNRFDVEQALRDSNIRYTTAQELTALKQSTTAYANYYTSERARLVGFYDKQVELQKGKDDEIAKINVEKNKRLSDLDKDFQLNQISARRKQQELEQKEYEDRRQALIEFKGLQVREWQYTIDATTSVIERGIADGTIKTQEGYNNLIDVTKMSNVEILRLTREGYQEQLKDKSLTKEQVINIRRKWAQEEKQITEGSARAISDIEKRKYQAIIDKVTEGYDQLQKLRDSRIATADTVFGGLLGNELSGKDFKSRIEEMTAAVKEYDRLKQAVTQANAAQTTAQTKSGEALYDGNLTPEQLEATRKRIDELTAAQQKANDALNQFNRDHPYAKAYEEYSGLADTLTTTNYNLLESYEKIQKAFAAKDEYNGLVKLQSQLEEAIRLRGIAERGGLDTKGYQTNIDAILSQITAAQAKIEAKTQDIRKTFISEIRGYINDINPYDKLKVIFEANQGIWQSAKETYQNIIALESKYYENSTLWGLKRKEAILEYNREIYEAEQNAIINVDVLRQKLTDKNTYSAVQANARVLEFLDQNTKSLTEIYADARTGAISTFWSGLDSAIGRATSKLGLFGGVVKQVISDLIKLATSKFFASIFGAGVGAIGPGGTAGYNPNSSTGLNPAGPGGPGGLARSAIQSILGGGSSGNLFTGGGLFGGGISSPIPVTASTFPGGSQAGARGAIGSGASGVLGGKFSLSSLKTSLGGLAPLFGLQAGIGLGGASTLGKIVGGAGGLLGGGVLTALLAPSLFGIGTAGGSSALLAGAYGLLTNPFTAVIAGGLLAGALLLGRDAARKRDEKSRAQLAGDAGSQISQLISQVRANRTDGQSAIATANGIRAQYIQAASQLKDSKTRKIALREADPSYSGGLITSKMIELQRAAEAQDRQREVGKQWTPEFAGGGFYDGGSSHRIFAAQMGYSNVLPRNFSGHIPGAFDRKDDVLLAVSRGEKVVVMNPNQWGKVGGKITPYLREAKVPGFKMAEGGSNIQPTPAAAGGADIFDITINIDSEMHMQALLKSPANRKAIFRTVNLVYTGKANR